MEIGERHLINSEIESPQEKKPYFLYAGRISNEKGLTELIDSFTCFSELKQGIIIDTKSTSIYIYSLYLIIYV